MLHAREGYWGGAPRVAHQWYERLTKFLREERFREAAHAAGVLSHYVTDMLQPLHTASDEREAIVHRPLEWSIEQSYDRILNSSFEQDLRVAIQLSHRTGWLGAMMLEAARLAEKRFDVLVQNYRFQEGVRQPEQGLDAQSIEVLAELMAVAVALWSRVIDRVAEDCEYETGYPIPKCHTAGATSFAVLSAPFSFWKRRVRYGLQTVAIENLAQEYFRTGRLDKWLPPEVDIKQRVIEVYHSERRRQFRRAS